MTHYYKQCSDLGCSFLIRAGFPHIQMLNCECFDVIQFFGNDFYLGNTFKYLWRLGKKEENPYKDVEKALVYLELYIEYTREIASSDDDYVLAQWYFSLVNELACYLN